MNMRPCRLPGGTHITKEISPFHLLAYSYGIFVIVGIDS